MRRKRSHLFSSGAIFGSLALGLLAASAAQAAQFTLSLVDGSGAPVSGFRWVLQQYTTFAVDPNTPATNADDMLSLSFHASNQPVATSATLTEGLSGNTDLSSVDVLDVPTGRYYVSVLPYADHSIGGAPVDLTAGDTEVTVTVQNHPHRPDRDLPVPGQLAGQRGAGSTGRRKPGRGWCSGRLEPVQHHPGRARGALWCGGRPSDPGCLQQPAGNRLPGYLR